MPNHMSHSRFGIKPAVGQHVSFPNLPFILDPAGSSPAVTGGQGQGQGQGQGISTGAACVKVSQSGAVLRHIGRRHGLLGASLVEQASVDQASNGALQEIPPQIPSF